VIGTVSRCGRDGSIESDFFKILSTSLDRHLLPTLKKSLENQEVIWSGCNFSISRGNFIETKPQHIEK
jgi:hypothetical protein